MESPFLLPRVDVSKMQQFREEFKTILNEPFRSPADMALYFFGDLMEMVEFVPDDANEVSH